MFIEGHAAAVCCSGLWRSTVGAHTTPTAFGPIVWLLNWSDRSEGRSRHSYYSALCTVMLGYRVCVYTSQFMLRKHVTHLCVFFLSCSYVCCTDLFVLLLLELREGSTVLRCTHRENLWQSMRAVYLFLHQILFMTSSFFISQPRNLFSFTYFLLSQILFYLMDFL